MSEKKITIKPNVKSNVKPNVKSNVKPNVKSKVKPKVKVKPKENEINRNVIVEVENKDHEQSEQLYDSKLKCLLHKIKSQCESQDYGIRFAWRN